MKEIVMKTGIRPGEKVWDGYSDWLTAPEEPGTYTLVQVVYPDNTHCWFEFRGELSNSHDVVIVIE